MMTQEKMSEAERPVLASTPPADKRLPPAPEPELPCALERDYYGCYCLKFIVKNGTHITEDKVMEDFGKYGEVVDVRGPGLFDVTGDDVYVRYKEKSSAEQALIELVGRYDSLCLAPPSDIQADKFG